MSGMSHYTETVAHDDYDILYRNNPQFSQHLHEHHPLLSHPQAIGVDVIVGTFEVS